jgi:hypothetical protein
MRLATRSGSGPRPRTTPPHRKLLIHLGTRRIIWGSRANGGASAGWRHPPRLLIPGPPLNGPCAHLASFASLARFPRPIPSTTSTRSLLLVVLLFGLGWLATPTPRSSPPQPLISLDLLRTELLPALDYPLPAHHPPPPVSTTTLSGLQTLSFISSFEFPQFFFILFFKRPSISSIYRTHLTTSKEITLFVTFF